jgi:hypothetical protein
MKNKSILELGIGRRKIQASKPCTDKNEGAKK